MKARTQLTNTIRQTTEHLVSLDYNRKDHADMMTKQQVSFGLGCV